MMDRKFCTSCQTLQPTELVKLVTTGKTRRWKCTTCLAGKSVGPYKGKKKDEKTNYWRSVGPSDDFS
jgi:hypothetical protein